MPIKPILAGVAAGVALAAGGIAAVDLMTEDAGAARGGGPVTQAQFKKLEARVTGLGQNSSAAQRISKNLQNILGKHVTPEGTLIGAKLPPGVIRQDRGEGGGLPTSAIADGAITSAKLAPGLLTQASAAGAGGLAGGALNGTFPNPGIAPGAVGADQLAPVLAVRLNSGTLAVPGHNVAATLSWNENAHPLTYDPFDLHTPAQPQRLTAPRDGLYYVSANVAFGDDPSPVTPSGSRLLILAHTDLAGTQRLTRAQNVPAPAGLGINLSGGQLFPMKAGEFVTAIARSSHDAGVIQVTPRAFSMVYAGPLA